MESDKEHYYKVVGSVDREKLFTVDENGEIHPVTEAVKLIELVINKPDK